MRVSTFSLFHGKCLSPLFIRSKIAIITTSHARPLAPRASHAVFADSARPPSRAAVSAQDGEQHHRAEPVGVSDRPGSDGGQPQTRPYLLSGSPVLPGRP